MNKRLTRKRVYGHVSPKSGGVLKLAKGSSGRVWGCGSGVITLLLVCTTSNHVYFL